MNKIENFIKENKLTFSGEGSGLNSDCCIISGFALHLGYKDAKSVNELVSKVLPKSTGFENELERVFNFAKKKNYGAYWATEEAKKLYKF